MAAGIDLNTIRDGNVILVAPDGTEHPLTLGTRDVTDVTSIPATFSGTAINMGIAQNGLWNYVTAPSAGAVKDVDGADVPPGTVLTSFTVNLTVNPANIAPVMAFAGTPIADITSAGTYTPSVAVQITDAG